jgi:hypothetical protein
MYVRLRFKQLVSQPTQALVFPIANHQPIEPPLKRIQVAFHSAVTIALLHVSQ